MSSSPAYLDSEAQSEKDTYVAHVTLEVDDHDRPRSPSAALHATAEVAPRLTSEFRTLSIHVETGASPEEVGSGSEAIRSKAVEGTGRDARDTQGTMCSPQAYL